MALNLDTFNKILFSAFKDQSLEKKKELLEVELDTVNRIIFDNIGMLLDELVELGYESELFAEIRGFMNIVEHLLEQIKELEKQIAEKEEK